MAKDPATMTHAERMSVLMRDLSSPACVAKADKLLELIGHEWLDVLGVRDMAARRHGDTSTAPQMPVPPIESVRTNELSAGSGTVARLVDSYRSDSRSPYHGLRYKTREHYDTLIKRLLEDCGNEKLADLKVEDIERFYKGWGEGGKTAIGKALITMLRSLVYFGATKLQQRDCERLSIMLHRMRFSVVQSRTERLTTEQAIAICGIAKKLDRASIALAQAFQLDCNFRQKDVIGEWVPTSEPGKSDVVDGDSKWLRGLRWDEIDANLILTHTTSKNQKEVVVDLNKAPMVLAELGRMFGGVERKLMPATGPIIVSETSGLPWRPTEFRRYWRKAADKAGVPRTVKNMDSRARTKALATDGMAA